MKYVEPDLAKNKELGKKGWYEVPMGRTIYDIDLVVSDLVCQDEMC